MTGFSAQWLALREPADHRARDASLRDQVVHDLAHLARVRPGPIKFVDLGCGSGSNLRALAPHMPATQHWTLVDYDPALLSAAKAALVQWADQMVSDQDMLVLLKNDKHISVKFLCEDLSSNLEDVLALPTDLLTAAAFFDLVAEDWLERFCGLLRSPLYTVLTYNGQEIWHPPEPMDAAMLKAFHAHQQTDKGFGAAAGPNAVNVMETLLKARGFAVSKAQSPWKLAAADCNLIEQLAIGSAGAVLETKQVSAEEVSAWKKSRSMAQTCEIGHTDLYARARQF
jgi:SAM-dependent methyltransferase